MNSLSKIILYLFSVSILLSACQHGADLTSQVSSDYYTEKHRPQYHFSPEANWMNDPNGMVFYEDEYHLFYQYYPDSTVWGPMHWGHAVTTDLVHWEHLPIALYPDEHGLIFSGSAVVDWQNTSGFGDGQKPPLVAIFSYHSMEKERAGDDDFQTQGIAYSHDNGRSWTKYEGNPVIDNPGVRDFRDPKVIWHEETETWIMAVAALDHLKFYGSPNLKEWQLLSEFGKTIGSHDGVWECPDLFPIIADNGKTYWVLIENMNPGNPNGGSGTQYFVGQFNGKEFIVDPAFKTLLGIVPEYVPDGQVFEDFENGYTNWVTEGTAFGVSPAAGALKNQQVISGYKGSALANSFFNGDESTGTLSSKPFQITRNAINFLIGGGNHRGRTLIALEIDGKRVREAEGRNAERLTWKGWDVSGYNGKQAVIKIIDNYTGSWGHINIDQIMFADEVAYGEKTGSVWLDAGRDNYAGVTWSDVPVSDGRRIFMGWMTNWSYAQIVPTEKWRSAMTIPLALDLKLIEGIPRLVGNPVEELKQLREAPITSVDDTYLLETGLAELLVSFSSEEDFELRLSNELEENVRFIYDKAAREFRFDRTQAGGLPFSADFPGLHTVGRISLDEQIELRAFIDHSSIELFLDDGANIFSETFFPTDMYTQLQLTGEINNSTCYSLAQIWR